MTDITEIAGIGPATADDLEEAGFESAEDIAAASWSDIAAVEGFAESRSKEIHEKATDLVSTEREQDGDPTSGHQDTDDADETEVDDAESDAYEVDVPDADIMAHVQGALGDEEVRMLKRHNLDAVEAITDIQAAFRTADGDTVELSEEQVNHLYTATNTLKQDYVGERGIETLADDVRDYAEHVDGVRSTFFE